MSLLSVDFAAKFSAASVVTESGEVHWEANSHDLTSLEWCQLLVQTALEYHVDLALIEDVPYGISNQAMVKPVLRLQGVLIAGMARFGQLDRTLFVNPATWQRLYPGVARAPKGLTKTEGRKYRENAARVAAAELGYSPPSLAEDYREAVKAVGKRPLKKHTDEYEKQETDHIDAYLMARWAYTIWPLKDIRSISGVQPVFA